MPEPALSLAMIVRDEERHLRRCLESVRGLAEEIVVVDTGSRDRTPEIAREFGARVLAHPWGEDFAEARNVSLAACRGPWILQLDADEALPEDRHGTVRAALLREDVEGWFLRQRNHHPSGCSELRAMRLWRSSPEARFVSPIHEQILPGVLRAAGRTGRRVESLPVGIEHYGYAQDAATVAAKLGRNVRMMERRLAEEPRDLHLRYLLAGTLEQLGRAEESLAAYARAFAHLRTLPEPEMRRAECGPNLAALYAQALLRERGDRPGARQVVSFGRSRWPDSPELRFLDGVLAREEGDLARAIRCFDACASAAPREEGIAVDEGVAGVKALLALGECWEAAGAPARARDAYARAAARDPAAFAPVHRLAGLAASRGDADAAIALYEAFLARRPQEAAARLHGGALLQDAGRFTEAGPWLEEAERLAPGDPRVRVQRARRALALGNLAECLAFADAGVLRDPDGAAAALVAAGLQGAPLPEVLAAPAGVAQALLGRVRDLAASSRPERVDRWLRGAGRLAAERPEIARAFEAALREGRAALTPGERAA